MFCSYLSVTEFFPCYFFLKNCWAVCNVLLNNWYYVFNWCRQHSAVVNTFNGKFSQFLTQVIKFWWLLLLMNISCLLCVTVLHESNFKALFLIGNRLHTISDAAAQLASCCPAGRTQRELYACACLLDGGMYYISWELQIGFSSINHVTCLIVMLHCRLSEWVQQY